MTARTAPYRAPVTMLATLALALAALAPLATVSQAASPTPPANSLKITGQATGPLCNFQMFYLSGGAATPVDQCGAPMGDGWRVDVPPNVLDWTFDDQRQFAKQVPSGSTATMSAEEHTALHVATGAGGAFGAAAIHVDASVEVEAGGDATAQQAFSIEFDTTAPSVVLSGSASSAATASGVPAQFPLTSLLVLVDCSAAGGPLVIRDARDASTSQADIPLDATLPLDGLLRHCRLMFQAAAAAHIDTLQTGPVPGTSASAHLTVDLTITAGPPACELSGTVRDGELAADGHANPMPGVRVELYTTDNIATGIRSTTDADGTYCLRGLQDKAYEIRAELVDAAHEPSLFKTVHGTSSFSETAFGTVEKEDIGRDDFDVDFRGTAEKPWLHDVANIHWQVTRFVDWLLSAGIVTAAELPSFTVETGSAHGTSYIGDDRRLFIEEGDTPFEARSLASSECPENCEWHELAHHTGDQLGIAVTCPGAANHAGWRNQTTCDSVSEGFASFLALLASRDIDAGRGPGYATTDYSVFGSLEDNGWVPWGVYTSRIDGLVYGDEDMAVSELLWDLVDDTPTEQGLVDIAHPTDVTHPTPDLVTLNGPELVRLMATAKVETVADLHAALAASDLVPQSLKVTSLDFSEDDLSDTSALDAVFLLHNFHPVHDYWSDPWYALGDPVGRTDRAPTNPDTGVPVASAVPSALGPRPHVPTLPGSAIRLQNGSTQPLTFSIDITYPTTSSHFEIPIAANASQLVHLELPPYWRLPVALGAASPACGAAGQYTVTLALSAPGLETRKLNNCEFLHAVEVATADQAITFGSGGAPTDGSGASSDRSSTMVLIAGVALLLAAVFAGFFLLGRRRGGGGSPAA